ncbi:hypothetical protein BURC_01759 [Burkholderiaceae bacterium]|nr:hypothetical protein BURC_01759 [Burkholderiaceae bacterium]
MPGADLQWDLFLRGAVASLLLFHLLHLALPGARPAARLALGGWTLSLIAYLFCQEPAMMLALPRPLTLLALSLCVSSTAWMWVAARALFNDDFAFSLPVGLALGAMAALGLAARAPHLPELAGAIPLELMGSLLVLHGAAMLAFTAATLWELMRGWQDDLVAPRRAARRWGAMLIGVYALVAVLVEVALLGRPAGRVLPLLHVAGIGSVTLALALLVARRSLADVIGEPMAAPQPAVAALPAQPPVASAALQRLTKAMSAERLYRREGLTLAALAETLGLGEAALRGLINQQLGYRNFNDFLHHYRLQEASERLAAEDLPILTIALECGYGSIGPFNRAFKQRMGMTPSEFRGAARLARA